MYVSKVAKGRFSVSEAQLLLRTVQYLVLLHGVLSHIGPQDAGCESYCNCRAWDWISGRRRNDGSSGSGCGRGRSSERSNVWYDIRCTREVWSPSQVKSNQIIHHKPTAQAKAMCVCVCAAKSGILRGGSEEGVRPEAGGRVGSVGTWFHLDDSNTWQPGHCNIVLIGDLEV